MSAAKPEPNGRDSPSTSVAGDEHSPRLAGLRTHTDEEQFAQQINDWRLRLNATGLSCVGIAIAGLGLGRDRDFDAAQLGLLDAWREVLPLVSAQLPVMQRQVGQDLLVVMRVQGVTERDASEVQHSACVGLWMAPPFTDKTIWQLQLSMGWLHLILANEVIAPSRRAAALIEQMALVQSQPAARAGAQEWINRAASWVRAEIPEAAELSLVLFEVRGMRTRWWVSSDAAWVEQGTASLRQAQELAEAALFQQREQVSSEGWALPIMRGGHVAAVLVVRQSNISHSGAANATRVLLRASSTLVEPLLAHWREAERSLPRHSLDAVRDSIRKIYGPGFWRWKIGAAMAMVSILILTLLPVDERVTAQLFIEGQARQLVVSPQEGFLAQVLVRPGDHVNAGQLLAKLDDRELRIERQRQQSASEQATAKLRQALGERNASGVQLAQAELGSAQALLELVESKLERIELRAPLAGLVVQGDWVQQIGAPIETGKQLFELAADPGRRVVLHIEDRDIARVSVDQIGELRLAGLPNQTYGFKVSQVTPTASVREGQNGFRVEARWSGDAPALSPGMQGVGKITVGRANLLTIWVGPAVDWLRLKIWSLGWWP